MRSVVHGALLLLMTVQSACFYVSKEDYLASWDVDEDGWPLGEDGDPEADCAPFHVDIFPYAPDLRGDGCDSDCGREIDADGDDFPDDADCAPTDPDVNPCATDTDGDGIDSDCDGNDAPRTDGLVCPLPDPSFPDATPIDPADCPASLGGTAQ